MITDRRIRTPEESKSPLLFMNEAEKETKYLLTDDGCRSDGRSWNDLRPISMEYGIVNNTTGSAYIEMGGTKILASVRGPRDLTRGEEFTLEGNISCELKFAPFSAKFRKNPKQDQEEKDLSNLIGQAFKAATRCNTFPKLQLDISLLVLEDCGSILAGAVICTTIAMVTGGVEMNDLPTACKVSFGGDKFLCDPISKEEYTKNTSLHFTPSSVMTSDMTVLYCPSLDELIGVYQCGVMDAKMYEQTMEVCVVGCKKLRETLQSFLKEQYNSNNN